MARPKKYHISLTDDELKELKSVMRKKQTTKTVRNRCQIIIDLDEAHGKVLTHAQSAKTNCVHGHSHGVCRQVVQQKQICCRCHSSYIRNPFSGCHPDEQAVAALHHPKAGMAFHPYRQQGTSGHMEVHKHQGHLPCRLQNQHLLLTEYTSNHSCEVEVYFF